MNDTIERLTLALAGRYAIEHLLGQGGMAAVYLARDERHQRLVAVKVMLPEAISATGAERFRREIQIAARLSHPNIVTVFDSGEVDDIFYYVMPFVQGQSLADALAAGGPLSIAEAVDIAQQVADALDYAHAEGVVHRDIKPANILLTQSWKSTRDGTIGGRTPVVTDFGIARALSRESGAVRLTSTGLMMGTPLYMSPEQAFGMTADGRSDQYSLACVLYEMLTGEPPFSGSNPMVLIARHTQDAVPSMRSIRSPIPDALEQAVNRALEKVASDRFPTMADFGDAIAAAAQEPAAIQARPKTAPLPRRVRARGRTYLIGGIAAVAILAAGAAGWRALRGPPEGRTRVMVLPFEEAGVVRDSTFADGLTEEIISRLSGVPRLGVVARTTAMKYKNTTKTAKEIGAELNVQRLVQGRVAWKSGETSAREATVTVSIANTSDNTETPVKEFNAANLDDVYGIANEVAAKLDVTSGMEDKERQRLLDKPTQSREAYEAYQRGNHFFNHSWEAIDVRAAIDNYYRATRLDPRFALAFAALGRAHGWIYQLGIERADYHLKLAQEAIDSAFRLAPDLPEAHLANGLLRYWGRRDYDAALREFTIVQRMLPSSAETYNYIGNIKRRQGALKEAAKDYQLSSDLDPQAYRTLFNRAEVLLYLRQFDEAEQLADRVIELAPDFIDGPLLKATLQIHRSGDVTTARRILADLAARIPPSTWRSIGHHWRAGLFRIIDTDQAAAQQRIALGSFGLDTAQYLISEADMYRRFGPPGRAAIYFDSAVVYMEATVKKHPERFDAFGQLAIAYAGLHRNDDAIHTAGHALQMINENTDALDGPEWLANIAQVYAMVGDVRESVDSLAKAMQIPSRLSPKWVALDPIWAPLRGDSRFKALAVPPRVVATRAP